MRRLARKLGQKFMVRQPEGVVFADLEDIHPIGNKRSGLITNKAGRVVLRARHKGRVVKLYEAFSAEHAHFIAAVSAVLPHLFPRVLQLRGNWVMAEWVEGQPLTDALEEYQANMLRCIHALPLDDLPSSGFCYWHDFLVPRFLRAATLVNCTKIANRLLQEINISDESRIIMHPDLSPANLQRTADGRIISIDNELLCIGTMPVLDLCNAMRSLPQEQRDHLAEIWFAKTPVTQQIISRTAKAWIVREVGSAFVSGQMQRCHTLFKTMEGNHLAWLPFSKR